MTPNMLHLCAASTHGQVFDVRLLENGCMFCSLSGHSYMKADRKGSLVRMSQQAASLPSHDADSDAEGA